MSDWHRHNPEAEDPFAAPQGGEEPLEVAGPDTTEFTARATIVVEGVTFDSALEDYAANTGLWRLVSRFEDVTDERRSAFITPLLRARLLTLGERLDWINRHVEAGNLVTAVEYANELAELVREKRELEADIEAHA